MRPKLKGISEVFLGIHCILAVILVPLGLYMLLGVALLGGSPLYVLLFLCIPAIILVSFLGSFLLHKKGRYGLTLLISAIFSIGVIGYLPVASALKTAEHKSDLAAFEQTGPTKFTCLAEMSGYQEQLVVTNNNEITLLYKQGGEGARVSAPVKFGTVDPTQHSITVATGFSESSLHDRLIKCLNSNGTSLNDFYRIEHIQMQ